MSLRTSLIAWFMGPTWGPSGADRTQVGPMLAPWTLLSGILSRPYAPDCVMGGEIVHHNPVLLTVAVWYVAKLERYIRVRSLAVGLRLGFQWITAVISNIFKWGVGVQLRYCVDVTVWKLAVPALTRFPVYSVWYVASVFVTMVLKSTGWNEGYVQRLIHYILTHLR